MSAHDCAGHSVAIVPGPAVPHPGGKQGFRTIRVGKLLITVLSDGATPLPFDKLLTGPGPGEVQERLASVGLETTVATSVNTCLVEGAGSLVLIDAGAGTNLPGCGKMLANLVVAGYRPEQVDAVLLTHIHPDHVGGLVSDTGIVFPNAELLASSADLEYWFNPEEEERAPPERRRIFAESKAGVLPYIQRGKVRKFVAGDEVLPGITTVAAPGHTAGHVLVRVESGGKTIVFFGDLVHLAAVQMPDPSVAVSLDSDQDTAIATRLEWFDRFAAADTLVAGAHMPFPGVGHIARSGASYAWLPLIESEPLDPGGGFQKHRDRK